MAEKERIILLTDRNKLKITGVKEVVSFDEMGAVLLTEDGDITIDGENIHISNLDTDSGEVDITGKINALAYTEDNSDKRRGLFGRLFG